MVPMVVRTTIGTIDGEEAQTCRWNAVKMGVGMRHQLIRFLRRRINTDGVIRIIGNTERRFGVHTVNGTG